MYLLISAFPGTGKSTIHKKAEEYNLIKCHIAVDKETGEVTRDIPRIPGVRVFDSDSSLFPKDNFPANYIAAIKETIELCPHVVILISSHEEVRDALKAAGLEYDLVYPNQSLKDEYVQRYEQRGSPESFVRLMNDRWEQFILSCSSDTIPEMRMHQLGEGQGVYDVMSTAINVIIKDAQGGRDEFNPEISTSEEVVVETNTPSRSEVKELRANGKADTASIEKMLEEDDPEVDGQEAIDKRTALFTATANYAKEQYGLDITPDRAGCESFLDSLKIMMKKAGEFLAGQPDKRDLQKVKQLNDAATKAAKMYAGSSWLDNQTFKEGIISIPRIPNAFKSVTVPNDVPSVLGKFELLIDKTFKEHENYHVRLLPQGIKLFNTYEKKDFEEKKEEAVAGILKLDDGKAPAKPSHADLIGVIDLSTLTPRSQLQALDKSGVVAVAKLLEEILSKSFHYESRRFDLACDGVSYDEFWDSEFWEEMLDSVDETKQLLKLIEWEEITAAMNTCIRAYDGVMLIVAQFLENWILYSVE